jgi:hypothetical protein
MQNFLLISRHSAYFLIEPESFGNRKRYKIFAAQIAAFFAGHMQTEALGRGERCADNFIANRLCYRNNIADSYRDIQKTYGQIQLFAENGYVQANPGCITTELLIKISRFIEQKNRVFCL